MLSLAYDPFPLVFALGDVRTQLAGLTFFGLSDSPRAKSCRLALLERQRADGAFPSSFSRARWGAIETIRDTLHLLAAGLPTRGLSARSAAEFLLEHQHPDGGWGENPALVIPPGMTWLSNERCITWLTADAVELLRRVGMGRCAEFQAALEWLRGMQNRHGGWPSLAGEGAAADDDPGDPDATAQITFLMRDLFGEDDPVYVKGRARFERLLDECVQDVEKGYWVRDRKGEKEDLDVYTVTHLLLSSLIDVPRRLQSGFDVTDPRVKRLLEALVDLQRDDGGWRPFWSEKSSPVYTVLAVEVLVLGGALVREDLEERIKAHAA